MSLDHAVLLIQHYKYLILFPLAVIEGPIITIIGGFLSSIGVLNLAFVFLTVVAGDIVGDTIWYSVGRFGHGRVPLFVTRYFGITQERLAKMRELMEKHPFKIFAIVKFMHGPTLPGLLAAGASRVSYMYFVGVCLVLSMLQSAVYETIGFFFGSAYHSIGTYLGNYAKIMFILSLVTLFIIFWRITHRKKTI